MGVDRQKNKEVWGLVQKVAKRKKEKCWPKGQQCQRIQRPIVLKQRHRASDNDELRFKQGS